MVFVGMEGKLPLQNMAIKMNYMHKKRQFKHHQMGLLIMKICCGKSLSDTLGCNKALTLLKLHSSPQLECLISQLVKKVKMVDDVVFFAKNTSSTLTMICNNCKYIMLLSFQGSNFNFYYIFAPRFAYILYMFRCDVHHLMN